MADFQPIARTDTNSNTHKHGVCSFVASRITFVSVGCSCPNVHVIYIEAVKCYFVVVYRPPSNNSRQNRELLDFLLSLCIGKEIVILGDFNLPRIDWKNDSSMYQYFDPLSNYFLSCFNSLGLVQWVKLPTFIISGNTLDLILTSEHDRIGEISALPPLPGCNHTPLICDYIFMHASSNHQTAISKKRDWVRGKYSRINSHIRDIDWDSEFEGLDLDSQTARFSVILDDLIAAYVPLTRPQKSFSKLRPPCQMTKKRKHTWNSFMEAKRLHGRKSLSASIALERYKRANWEYKNYLINYQINYENSLSESFGSNPKAFHKYIRSKKVSPPSIGPLKSGNSIITYNHSMAVLFNHSFSSVFRESVSVPSPHQMSDVQLTDFNISLADVETLLSRLDVSSSMGPDGIHPRLLRSCPAIARPLYLIYSESLSLGSVPLLWKTSEVIPIFKKGVRSDPLNYRPISLTSVCCKTLERAIAEQLTLFLEENNLLSRDQFGFRRGRTVQDQLPLAYESVTKWYDEGSVVDVILFDFAKAFDVVDHKVLLAKLRCIGIGGKVLSWLESFLCGRSMFVSVGDSKSSRSPVRSGVPQGSVLGPLLFLVHVNFIPNYIRNRCKIFADDLKLYLKIRALTIATLAVDITSCQRDIDMVAAVAESWGLFFNIHKCFGLRFHRRLVDWDELGALDRYYIKGSEIQMVSSHKDLGVFIDTSLRFHIHIRSIASKASGMVSNYLKSTLCRSRKFMLSILKTHIRPLMEFCSSVWCTNYLEDLRLLESVQRRWTRHIDGLSDLSYDERLKDLDLYSVQGRLLRADLIMCWKIFHGLSSIAPEDLFLLDSHPRTRGHRFKIRHKFAYTEARKRFFSIRCISSWNSLPDSVVSSSTLQTFKSGLHKSLGQSLFEYV